MASVTVAAAFVAGLVAFFSPCVLPVMPGFVAFVARRAGTDRLRGVLATASFVLGFAVCFVVLGMLVGLAGSTPQFQHAKVWLDRIGGTLVILLGFSMIGLIRVPILDRDLRLHQEEKLAAMTGGPFLLGAAFGVGWSPCVGPVLATILIEAGSSGNALGGGALLAVFSLGLGVPFLLFGLAADRGAAFTRRFARFTQAVEVVGGVLLCVLGVFVFTGSINRFIASLPW